MFQEKSIALKIFELGLKRYNDVPEYALCYIEFMSHLNGEFTPSPQKTASASSDHINSLYEPYRNWTCLKSKSIL